ncbi:hypothetical protein WJ968_08455 [Achromobacter xylosoxidans]
MKSSKPVAIVGAAESDLGKVPGMTSLDLQAQAAARALRDAGLALKDVDGVFAHVDDKFAGLQLAEYLGIRPRYVDSTSVGGMSNVMHVRHAMAAIQAGMCEVALVAYGSTAVGRLAQGRRRARGHAHAARAIHHPYGQLSPIGYYAMVAQLHVHHPSRPGGSGGGGAQMGAAQSPCLPARGHVDRRGDGLAPDRGPAAPARLLPGDRCRRRLHPDHGRARPARCAARRCTCWASPSPFASLHAVQYFRLARHQRGGDGGRGAGDGRRHAPGHRRGADL